MAGANKKTTMAKLNRERKLRERRVEKQARKDARKQGSAGQRGHWREGLTGDADQAVVSVTEHDARAGGSATGGEPEAAPNEPGT
jgi:hypothetical protein